MRLIVPQFRRTALQLSVALLAAVMLTGCSKPRIDTSSDEAMGASVTRVRDSLPEEKRKEFDDAYIAVAMQGLTLESMMTGTVTPGSVTGAAKARLNGKTADEIIAEAAKLKADAEAKARTEAEAEMAKLEKAKVALEAAKVEMAKFQVIDARFRQTKNFIDMLEPMITLTVKNNTPHAVSRAFFVGTLSSPGRAVPWLREEFNYSIRGGLEPGEQATWNLSPNQFSEWGTVRPGKDAGLRVEVVGLEGADGKRLFTDAEFDEEDAARLASLRKQYGS